MKFLKFSAIVLTAVSLFVSCKKEDPLPPLENIPGLGGDQWVKTAIDKWIDTNYTQPYNIAVKYKWDQGEIDLDKTLVPPSESQIIPVMSAINDVWVKTYVEEAGTLFFKNIAPKFFVLVGSPAYDRGSIKLGTAEGGRKVVLYDMNNFRIKGMPGFDAGTDSPSVVRMFQTIQHEFAHILDQNIRVPSTFNASSANAYTSDWLNLTNQDAHDNGFITPYSQSSRDDDWAEMVSFLLVNGKDYFESYVNSINYTGTTTIGTTAAQARQRLRDKETALVTYFNQAWNIDFYQLQAKSRIAINSLLY